MSRDDMNFTLMPHYTSRSQLNRLLDAKDTSINQNTMAKIARVMGKTFRIQFEQRPDERP